ncbi:MAG: periplasmic heavy metal sensor [Bacteroidetes bacterium]|nr:MAG: periplasmic heavy metal sensor [Bacteroidota bacterium]
MALKNMRTTTWVILALIVVNLATLATVWLGPRRAGPPPPLVEMWKQELGLNDQQTAHFREQTRLHRQAVQPLFRQMAEHKKHMIQVLSVPEPDTVRARQLADSTAFVQHQLDLRLQEYYLALRLACSPAQVAELNRIFLQTLHPGPAGPHHGPPPDR